MDAVVTIGQIHLLLKANANVIGAQAVAKFNQRGRKTPKVKRRPAATGYCAAFVTNYRLGKDEPTASPACLATRLLLVGGQTFRKEGGDKDKKKKKRERRNFPRENAAFYNCAPRSGRLAIKRALSTLSGDLIQCLSIKIMNLLLYVIKST